MNQFNLYSRYYDLLYKDKPYGEEVQYISDLISMVKPLAGRKDLNILDLGCGTGRHALELSLLGHQVTGVDLSLSMLEKANQRRTGAKQLSFHQGDVRNVRLDEKFDVVLSLFHVASYQTTNEDILSFFKTAHTHLKHGGLFLFDFWYGPAVFHLQPTIKVLRLNDATFEVTRIAEPDWCQEKNIVTVNYEIITNDLSDGKEARFREHHKMRYFFLPEISFMLESAGFAMNDVDSSEFQNFYGWMTKCAPDRTVWGTVCLAIKN